VCFLGVFSKKWIENEILDEKTKDPVFLAITVARF
jgi:hypothetical protein